MRNELNYTDKIICEIDRAIRMNLGLLKPKKVAVKANYNDLTSEDKKTSARLMRINHTGEICAQGLYQGQALSSQSQEISGIMKKAAEEETDHLISGSGCMILEACPPL